MTRWGITVPIGDIALPEQREVFALAEESGYTDLWSAEVDGYDAFAPLLLAAGWGSNLRLGTAIANVSTRGPAILAMSAAALAAVAPGHFALGIGVSTPAVVEGWNGMTYGPTLSRSRDMLAFLRAALEGKRTGTDYATLRTKPFRLASPPAVPPRLLLAAGRPRMLRLAGQLADGFIINWVGPEDVRRMTEVAHSAVIEAGRDPATFEVVVRVAVNLTDDIEGARAAARRSVASYMSAPGYEGSQAWLGRGHLIAPVTGAWHAGRRDEAVAAVPDSFIDEVRVIGDAAHCRARLHAYADAGATTVVLALTTHLADRPAKAAVHRAALRALAPGGG